MENYFNYFTEIEECYRRCRSTPTLLSPLDWALIESWKEAGIPLDAVRSGIERSFTKFQKRPQRIQKINSLAYCTQQVLSAAQEIKDAGGGGTTGSAPCSAGEVAPPFTAQEIQDYLRRNAEVVEQAARAERERRQVVLAEDLAGIAVSLREAAINYSASPSQNLQVLELLLSALEEKVTASLIRASEADFLAKLRGEVERGLGLHRRQMSAAQIESLHRQFLKKRLYEHYELPRLSLFYL